jgi:hypothetical protein
VWVDFERRSDSQALFTGKTMLLVGPKTRYA